MRNELPFKELLKQKRDGLAWSDADVQRFVDGVTTGQISDSQVGAFLMAACTRGLTIDETVALTKSMARSGECFVRSASERRYIDKHSTGGVGDKVSILLAPLMLASGIAVPMISGRGLGHTGGTVDKLESVVGMKMDLSMTELRDLLLQHHGFMSAATPELAPADKRLYSIRDVTGTVENIGLITSSILSKKLAEGLDGLVMDVKVGRGAFMISKEEALSLGRTIQSVAKQADVACTVVYTAMDNPLGWAVGNWIEVWEAEQALAGLNVNAQLRECTEVLGAEMLLLAEKGLTHEEARAIVQGVWNSGRAHSEFHDMLRRQGGNWKESMERAMKGTNTVEVVASTAGYIADIDARLVALAVLKAGGGRLRDNDKIDPFAGVLFSAERGTATKVGDVIAHAQAGTPERSREIAQALERVFSYTEETLSKQEIILTIER